MPDDGVSEEEAFFGGQQGHAEQHRPRDADQLIQQVVSVLGSGDLLGARGRRQRPRPPWTGTRGCAATPSLRAVHRVQDDGRNLLWLRLLRHMAGLQRRDLRADGFRHGSLLGRLDHVVIAVDDVPGRLGQRWPRKFRQPDRWTLCFVATGQRPEKAEEP